jgi:hypothetical protein
MPSSPTPPPYSTAFCRHPLILFLHLQPLTLPLPFLHLILQKFLSFLLLTVLHQKMGFPWDQPIHWLAFLKTRAPLLSNENTLSLLKKTRTALLPPAPRLHALLFYLQQSQLLTSFAALVIRPFLLDAVPACLLCVRRDPLLEVKPSPRGSLLRNLSQGLFSALTVL